MANKVAAPLAGIGGAALAAGGVLVSVVPGHLAGIPLFGGVGIFLVLCLPGAAKGVRACKQVCSIQHTAPVRSVERPYGGRAASRHPRAGDRRMLRL